MTSITAGSQWTEASIPDLSGMSIIVTGASSGIGREAARAFASRGAHVVLAVRDEAKGAAAAESLEGSVEVRQLDLASLGSVRAFARDWKGDVDILVNNAGVMMPPLGRTVDGFELQFGTNHLGHFALTNLLLPRITRRIVTVASSAHRTARIDFGDPNWHTRRYGSGSAAYGQSKLANLLFTAGLQRRLEASGSAVTATAAHPGMAETNLNSSTRNPLVSLLGKVAVRWFAQTAAAGAGPTIYAATEQIPGGSYVGPARRREMSGPPQLVRMADAASDEAIAAHLWMLSEELTGVRFPL
jgi:NAD(P)-dependent dehydrogenase (short-subunit alcohol dehydrogenase family)